ncbi:hypothetical protein ACFQ3R_04295 [Mesonia ostreae]|uniref:Uncharacterized protein n=1 Tax=Mesonia ostreae TaxID=861110 RepID=A0ABU2KIU2_9FLAO|nr:hypothetical protein [Mesonia ostreae]MDT0294630.1 hypothetical protein [Mesonia ostreae]
MKKVSPQQINRLYQFTDQHFVDYYDVQLELVDHLANAIEEQWQENPEKDFETALQEEFKKFGVFGFLEVVESRQVAMQKRYHQLMWKEAKEFLKLPKVLILTAAFLVSFTLITQIPNGVQLLIGLLVLVGIVFGLKWYKNIKKAKILVKNTNRKPYLLETLLNNMGQAGIYMNLPIQILIFIPNLTINHFWTGLIYGLFLTIFCLVFYITLVLLPRKRDEILQEAYPELKMEQV